MTHISTKSFLTYNQFYLQAAVETKFDVEMYINLECQYEQKSQWI